MSSLPEISRSIDDHLMVRGRATWKNAPTCTDCGDLCYPRGHVVNTGRCWWCEFPRARGAGAPLPATGKDTR